MNQRAHLKTALRPLHVGSLALGCIIGFGCFVLPGDFLKAAGPLGATLGIVLGGLAMIVITQSYGLMVNTFPVAGAEFAYAYYAAGRYHAYVCGWFLTLGYLSIVPLNATALAILGKFLAPDLFARGYLYTVAGFDVFAGEVVLASAAIVVVGYFNYRGVKDVGNVQVVMTTLLVSTVVVVGVGTFTDADAAAVNWQPYFAPERSPVAAVLAMLAISPWLYVGFDTLPQAAEELAFSPKQAFRLMAVSILAGAAMYVTVILATGMVMPWRELVAGGHLWMTGTTVRQSLGGGGVAFLGIAVVMAIFTGINGFFMASSRLIFSMGRARLLPAWFGKIDGTHSTPVNAIVFTGLVSLMAPWFGREVIVWVVDMAAVGTAFGYGYTCLAAYAVAGQSANPGPAAPARRYALLGGVLSVGFIVLLCVPGMPAFMAVPSWVALVGWVAMGGLFFVARAKEYAAIPAPELDHLILGEHRSVKELT